MNENLKPGMELTAKPLYPTLDTAHSFQNVSITMPEPTEPQQPQESHQSIVKGRVSRTPIETNPGPQEKTLAENVQQLAGTIRLTDIQRAVPDAEQFLRDAIKNAERLTKEGKAGDLNAIFSGEEPIYDDSLRDPVREEAGQKRPDPREHVVLLGRNPNIISAGFAPGSPAEAEMKSINRRGEHFGMTEGELRETYERIEKSEIYSDDEKTIFGAQLSRELQRVREAELREAVKSDNDELSRRAQKELENPTHFGFYLEVPDLRDLDHDPMGWLEQKFVNLYNSAKKGTELESPVLQRLQTMAAEASAYLESRYERERKNATTPELAKLTLVRDRMFLEFNENFKIRLDLMYARTAIEQQGMEQIIGAGKRLRTDGMLGALKFHDGRVGVMFERMQGMLEHLRNAEGGKEHHLNPETLNKLQDMAIEEQVEFAKIGLGEFADAYRELMKDPDPNKPEELDRRANAENLLRSEIVRDARTAYDVLVISQQVAKIATQGKYLSDRRQYFGDVGTAFGVFNIEQYSINKWKMFSEPEMQFFEFLKLDLALNFTRVKKIDITGLDRDQLLDLGTRLFRDLYAVPDFFSNSWRITAMRDQLTRVMKYKEENDVMILTFIDAEKENNTFKLTTEEQNLLRTTDVDHQGARDNLLRRISIQDQIDAGIREGMLGWDDLNPHGESNVGDRLFARRQIARKLFDGLGKKERDLLLSYLSKAQKDSIKAEAARRAGTVKGREVGDFALFLQLNQNLGNIDFPEGTTEKQKQVMKDKHRMEVWKKIRDYRPEEMIRILRTRAKGDMYHEDQQTLESIQNLFSNIDSDLGYANWTDTQKEAYLGAEPTGHEKNATGRSVPEGGNLEAFNAFDKFSEKYGPIIHAIREDAMRNGIIKDGKVTGPEQVDFTKLSPRHLKMVDTALGDGSAQKLQTIYKEMQKFLGKTGNPNLPLSQERVINMLMNNQKYKADLYTRVIISDDVFLADLQTAHKNADILTVADYLAAEANTDALGRNLGDIAHANNVMTANFAFMKTEDEAERIKQAGTMEKEVAEYNGWDNGVDAFRFSAGTEYLFSMQNYAVNLLHLGKLPFRIPDSPKQLVYGPGADTLTRGQIREKLDKLRGSFEKSGHHESGKPWFEQPDVWFHQMELLTQTDARQTLKRQTLTFLIYMWLGLIVGVPAGSFAGALAAGTIK